MVTLTETPAQGGRPVTQLSIGPHPDVRSIVPMYFGRKENTMNLPAILRAIR